MKRKKIIYLAGILLLLFLTGCHTKEEIPNKGTHLFYQNIEGTGLVMVDYEAKETDATSEIQLMLDKLKQNPDSVEMRAAIPKDVEVENFVLEDGVLHLYMNQEYGQLDKVQEVLVRAALVQSLIQIEEVDAVDLYVGDQPLLTKSGKEVGLMDDKSFVKNTGTAFKSFQKTTLTLFYPNKKGDKLLPVKEDAHYFGNVSMEKLVLEHLMQEPESNEAKRILPESLPVLNTSVKDGICYINFGKEFLTQSFDAAPETVIYGIVNSIVSNCDVSRVQFSIEGNSMVKFMGKISLEEPFERNIELVENE